MQGQYPGDRSGSFFLDDAILAGSPTVTHVTFGTLTFANFLRIQIDQVPPPFTLHLSAGDSVAVAIREDWEYNPFFEDLTQGYYMLRTSGGGALDVADTFDLDYWYPDENPGVPWSWTTRALAGADGEFQYYPSDPTFLDQSHLDSDGYPLVRLTCTSGSVDITFVGMRINQTQGYFVPELDEDDNPVTVWSDTQPPSDWEPTTGDTFDTTLVGSDAFWTVDGSPVFAPLNHTTWVGADTSFVGPQDSLDLANADFHPFSALLGPETFVSTQHVPLTGDIFGGFTPEHWSSNVQDHIGYATVPTESVLPALPPGYADFQDWIAAGWEWLDGDTFMLGWHFPADEVVGSDIYTRYLEVRGDADVASFMYHLHSASVDMDTDFPDPDDGTVVVSGLSVDNAPGDPRYRLAITDTFITTTSNLLLMQVSLLRRTVAIEDKYTVEFGYSAGSEGTSARPLTIRSSDDSSVAVGVVRARYRVPTWRYQIPVFVRGWNLASGQLKVWLPSAEWRIIGNTAGSATERLKIQSEDLTWWKEYRTVDGAVTVHPLKLYTADGWVVASQMTPE